MFKVLLRVKVVRSLFSFPPCTSVAVSNAFSVRLIFVLRVYIVTGHGLTLECASLGSSWSFDVPNYCWSRSRLRLN